MTVILNNNSYKYETEAVVKIFMPAMRFVFLSDVNNADGDICMTRLKKGRSFTYLFACVRLDGKMCRKANKVANSAENYSSDCENALCRLVYLCFSRLTEKTPPWGMLTGVRPVKIVNGLIEKGFGKEEIFEFMRKKYLTEDNERLNLLYETSKIQLPLLKKKPLEKTFSLYVSIPFCPSRCSYCSFVSHSISSAGKLIPEYVELLCRELDEVANTAKVLGLELDTVYFGGGTPTALSAEQLRKILEKVQCSFDLSSIREFCIEAGRPDTIDAEKLEIIKAAGATRISINPQSLNQKVLEAIGRRHTAEDIFTCFELARKCGFDNINMDVIAGLPADTPESFKETLDGLLRLSPENITIHTLTLKRSAGLYSDHDSSYLAAAEMVDYARKSLKSADYYPYYLYRQKNTIDNLENVGYSKSGKESLYNILIMDECQTILGAGCGASTKLVSSGGNISRVYNYKYPYEYINSFENILNRKQDIIRFFSDNI